MSDERIREEVDALIALNERKDDLINSEEAHAAASRDLGVRILAVPVPLRAMVICVLLGINSQLHRKLTDSWLPPDPDQGDPS
jgi:hypothetical protein